jgi:NADH-quinone oxidoreductase subunit H
MQLTDVNVGVLFILAVSSMGVYGIALAGWSSNNKYSAAGRPAQFRADDQLRIADEPGDRRAAADRRYAEPARDRGFAGRLQLGFIPQVGDFRRPFPQIFSFIIFMIAAFAETNRIPFDLPEAENELVAGFHTEYSSMTFAAFFMAEYANMVTVCSMATLLFLGGWHPLWPGHTVELRAPLLSSRPAPSAFITASIRRAVRPHHAAGIRRVFFGSARAFSCSRRGSGADCRCSGSRPSQLPAFRFIWIRATLPRFRYDQLMAFAWKFLFPVALVNLLVTGFWWHWFPEDGSTFFFSPFSRPSRCSAPSTWCCRSIRFRAPCRWSA